MPDIQRKKEIKIEANIETNKKHLLMNTLEIIRNYTNRF